MSTAAPSRSRKFVFSAIVALVLLSCLELVSAIALYSVSGRLFSPGGARAEREAVLQHARRLSNRDAARSGKEDGAEKAQRRSDAAPEVVHPFLGYVRDPTFEGARFPLTPLGFFDTPPPPGPETGRFTLGIFGGSVAVGLSRSERLVEALESSPTLAGKKVWVRGFALGGYKQPQQLIALNYALALGESFDLVLNLDGFNDVALAPAEHAESGLFPFYPRQWPHRVSRLPNAESQRLIGEIAYLEGRRATGTGWCSPAPLSLSPTCHLAWKLLDYRAAHRVTGLRTALAAEKAQQRQYLTLGPRIDYPSGDELLGALAELWGNSSLQMHQLCAARGIPYFHFLQPNQYFPGSKKLSLAEKREAWSAEQPWAEIIPEAYPRLARIGHRLAATGVRFHDLRRVFEDVDSTLYVDTCCHFNQQGMDLVAEAIAGAMLAGLEAEGT